MKRRPGSRRAGKARRAPAASPDLRIAGATRADRAALVRSETKIRKLLARGEAAAWDVGVELDRIAAGGLHHAEKFATLEAYCEARFPQGYGTLKRYRRVATKFTRATTRRYGTWKLDLGLDYLHGLPERHRPAELLRLDVAVPIRGGTEDVPFAQVEAKQLEKAIELQQRKPVAGDTSASAVAKRMQAKLQQAVAAPKGTHRHAPLVHVHAHHESGGNRIDVKEIDEADLPRVLRALLAAVKKRRAR